MNQQQARADNDRRALRSWHKQTASAARFYVSKPLSKYACGKPGFDADQLSLLIDEAMEMMRKSPALSTPSASFLNADGPKLI